MELPRLQPSEALPSVLSAEAQNWRALTAKANDPAKGCGPQGIHGRSTYPPRCDGPRLPVPPIDFRSNRRALRHASRRCDRTPPEISEAVPEEGREAAHPL